MKNERDLNQRKKFFYAEADAGMYDASIEWVVPYYKLLQETKIQLMHNHFSTRSGKSAQGTILDIGSGTGLESIKLLQEFPSLNVMALDLCEPMHSEFRRNFHDSLGSDYVFEERCKLLTGDILATELNEQVLKAELPDEEQSKGYVAVVSGFVIHHFTLEEKAKVYQRIYNVLEPGGIFLNGDLFGYMSPSMSRQAHDFDIAWIRQHFEAHSQENLSEEERMRLSGLWQKHYQEDNLLDPVSTQTELLKAIGFKEVACPMRYWQVGLLWAIK